MGGGAAVGGVGAIIVGIIYFLMGGDPSQLTNAIQGGGPQTQMSAEQKAADDTLAEFASVVLKDTEDVWNNLMDNYQDPKMVLFRNSVQTACGGASSAVGPFYCPGDSKVYLDLSFFQDLKDKFGAGGDFAMAYVIAHEVGHHIQNLQGTSNKVHNLRSQVSEKEYNKMSVRLELQADFLAGDWAHHAQKMKNMLQEGDIEEALNAANAIGDDKLQKQARGEVVPDAFTHGTSAQRMYWFKKGFTTGDIRQGNTFEEVQ